jgi:hypothetical protein
MLRLRERKLITDPVERVAPVCDPVRPRDQQLPASGQRLRIGAEPVEQLASTDRVRAEAAADLDDDRTLPVVRDLELLAGRGWS